MLIPWKNLPQRLTVLTASIVLLYGSGVSYYLFSKKDMVTSEVLGEVEMVRIEYRVPKRLMIPSIKVYAEVEEVGVSELGAMDVPEKITEVGWFGLGPRPGVAGSAVMAGHLNGKNGERGVFADLDKVRVGDKFFVEDETGAVSRFVVREIKSFEPGFAAEVFEKSDGTYLNLITCVGEWTGAKKGYSKRLVVFGELET